MPATTTTLDCLYPVESIIDYTESDGITINLILTEQCNFACDHCFFGCSPQGKKGYMSNDILEQVIRFVQDCRDDFPEYPCITINLIGGEPTLNLKEFRRCFEYILNRQSTQGNFDIEMTTNGWWLHPKHEKSLIEFLRIVDQAVPGDGTCDGRYGIFRVRISDTEYHNQFRVDGDSIKRRFDTLFGNSEDGYMDNNPFVQYTSTCTECGHERTYWCEGDACEDENCDGTYESDEQVIVAFTRPDKDYGWIYVDTWGGDQFIVPSHPERGQFGTNDRGARGGCGHHMVVTFKPDGSSFDGCCRGSNMPFGSVYDHPLVLLGLQNSYLQQERPSCRECHKRAKEWRRSDEYSQARAYYEQEVVNLQEGAYTLCQD